MSAHDGHRQRTKDRIVYSDLETIDDHVLLEALLFYAIPRKDTNVLAHEILDHFGSIDKVLEADFSELKAINGVGENAACLITLVKKLDQRYHSAKTECRRFCITDSENACDYFKSKYEYERREVAYALFLDSAGGIIRCEKMSSGVVNSTDFNIRKLMEFVIRYQAVSVVVSHNHPDTRSFPSLEDQSCTDVIRDALQTVDVKLLDHVIVGTDGARSLLSGIIM